MVAHLEASTYPVQVALKDTHAMLPKAFDHKSCLSKFSGAILSSNAIFFNGPTTQTIIYFAFRRCSFGCCVTTSMLLCRFNSKGLVISLSYYPFISFFLCPFFYSTPYLFWYTTSYNCASFH